MTGLRFFAFCAGVVAVSSSVLAPNYDEDMYKCASCRHVLTTAVTGTNLELKDLCTNLDDFCTPEYLDMHTVIAFRHTHQESYQAMSEQALDDAVLAQCHAKDLCPIVEYWQLQEDKSDGSPDIRVSKAHGKRGYNFVRISLISNSSATSPFFRYQSRFRLRWTNKYLQSSLVPVHPGANKFQIDPQTSITVNVPAEDEGVRGLVIADPCFSESWITCVYGLPYDMLNSMTTLFNSFLKDNQLSYFGVLGDNFYDQDGHVSEHWFKQLSLQAKSKMMISVPGNHDFWVLGTPYLTSSKDQFGNGFMQYYAQDVQASVVPGHDVNFLDFSVNPDNSSTYHKLAKPENFFFYNRIGNTAFVGFSGGHSYASTKPYFQEACAWLGTQNVALALLVGHWNEPNLGCDKDMTVPAVYDEIKAMPGCAKLGKKLKYLMGHVHCNEVTQAETGFMLGGQGMADNKCNEFGLPVIDTTGGRARIMYFPVRNLSGLNNFTALNTCLQQRGYSGCTQFAKPFLDVPLSELEGDE